jgi:uncharacterized PurR-regulated membrane protein YhhQ (DUF165 family)
MDMEQYQQLAISDSAIQERRERVFLVLAGIFICSMTMLNVIGSSRFIEFGPLALTIGVLPYPLTFLCTDLVSELYGRKRANFLVTLGLGLNLFIFLIMTIAHWAPAVPDSSMPPWQKIELAGEVIMPGGVTLSGQAELYDFMYALSSGAIFASMLAYTAAQYCDVKLFHFWKSLTKGKHLWLRNNFSTLVSQAVDSIVVIGIVFGAAYLAGEITTQQLLLFMLSSYLFKVAAAAADTLPFYYLTAKLKRYLQIQ